MKSRTIRNTTQASYTPSNIDSSPTPDHRLPVVTQREQNDIMTSRKDEEITRKTTNIPVSNTILEVARREVVHNETDYAAILQQHGYTAVVDAAYGESRKMGHPFLSDNSNTPYTKLTDWRYNGVQILADTPLVILQSLLDDSLAEKVEGGDPSHHALADYFDQSNYVQFIQRATADSTGPHVNRWVKRHKVQFSPSFYVRILANANGQSPTPVQMRKVITRMRQYISGDLGYVDECVAIDNAFRSNRSDATNIRDRQHYFLEGSVQRVQVILTFCEALEDLLQTHAPPGSMAESMPFKYKVKYFGFTTNDSERNKRHDAGRTNWLKALYHSICKAEFHDADNQPEFTWHHYVIGFPVSVDECHLGEEIFCQIGCGYFHTGLGFNIQPAGISIGSAYLTGHTPQNAAQMWKRVLQWREEGPDFPAQLDHDLSTYVPLY
jgi:hypothetical protein